MTPSLLAVSATVPDIITFVVSAAFILVGAVGVVSSRNTVHAALSLILTLFGVAVLFVEQRADFLAVVQVIVYAGAIVVLFLFVIMFLGVDRMEDVEKEPLRGQRPLAFLLMVIALAGVLALFIDSHWVTGAHSVAGSTTAGGHTNVYLLGKSVFTTYLFAFEATAGLLVIAVVGAVVLARRSSGALDDEPGPDSVLGEPGPDSVLGDEPGPAGIEDATTADEGAADREADHQGLEEAAR